MLINYLVVGTFWSLFAVKRQQEIFPNGKIYLVWICWILNFLFWPLAMIIARFFR